MVTMMKVGRESEKHQLLHAQWFSAGAGVKQPVVHNQFNGLKATTRSFHLLSATVAHLDKIGRICYNEYCISHERCGTILTWGKFQPIL